MKDDFFQEESLSSNLDSSGFDFSIIRPDGSLFKDENYVPLKCLRIKHILTKKQEYWEFCQDNQVVGQLGAAKFSELERKFLRGVQGTQFLLQQFKLDDVSFSSIKSNLRNLL